MEKTKVEKLKDMMKAKKEAEEKKGSARPEPVEGRADEVPLRGSSFDKLTMSSPRTDESDSAAATDEIDTQIKAAEDEAKAHYDKFLRVMADFENFKKRIERERIEQAKYSNQSLIHDLLPVMDDFDRVLEHVPKELVDGIKLVQNHFMTALSKHGLVALEPSLGKPFDPNQHEAIAHVESDEYPEGVVCMEHRRGWKLHDRIVRAATVSVSKGKLS